jgi:hypothetical protein
VDPAGDAAILHESVPWAALLSGTSAETAVRSLNLSRVNASRLPLLIVEGGWTSAGIGGASSSPDRQARWIRRQFEIAAAAEARHVFQLQFTDLDLAAFGQGGNPYLVPFASLGLVTADLAPKQALAEWDAMFARPRR